MTDERRDDDDDDELLPMLLALARALVWCSEAVTATVVAVQDSRQHAGRHVARLSELLVAGRCADRGKVRNDASEFSEFASSSSDPQKLNKETR